MQFQKWVFCSGSLFILGILCIATYFGVQQAIPMKPLLFVSAVGFGTFSVLTCWMAQVQYAVERNAAELERGGLPLPVCWISFLFMNSEQIQYSPVHLPDPSDQPHQQYFEPNIPGQTISSEIISSNSSSEMVSSKMDKIDEKKSPGLVCNTID